MSSPTAATRTPQSKSTAGGASKVRGAAAMWENKLATNTDSAKGNSPPKHSNARKPKPLDSNGQRSPSTASSLSPSTPKRGLKANGASSPRNGASSPRNLTPPSSFKADSKPAGRARSGSVSAKAASPPVRSSSPPPLPQMPAVLKQESKSEAGEDDSIYSDKAGIDLEDGVVEGDSIAKAAEPSVLSPEVDSAAPPMDEAELNDAMLDVMLEDAKLDSVNLDELQLDDVQLDTVQLDDKPQMNGERSSAPLDFSLPAEDVPQSPVAVAAKSPTLSTGSPHLPDPVPVVTLADPIPTPIAKDHGDVHKAELDVTDLPRRSTSRPRTPPAGGLSPGTPENASPTPTTPARSGLQSIFGRMMPASSPVTPAKDLDADINDAKSDDSAIKDRSATAPGKSFFSSATSAFNSIQLPSVSLPSLPAASSSRSNSQLTPPTESPAVFQNLASPPHSATMAGSSWRTTMSSFLQRSTSPQPPTAPLPTRNGSTSGAALLTKRFESPTASRDRRISHEAGGSTQLREGFERVRNEMEGAARDIRRERAGRGESVDGDVDWAFWGSVVQDYEEVARTRPKDLSRAIQQGIPAVIRGPIWQLMSSSKSLDLEETYKALLKLPSPHEKAIQKDITRTFPDHKFFQGVGAGQDGLFMVVKAYSLYDVEVGYTQGLAFVVASLLLNMPDEEAFCVLVRLMDSYNLRSHFTADMPGLQLRLYQFDRLVEDLLPLLYTHLVRKGVKSSMFASQWFMTLFSYRFPLSLVYRVLDIVLAEGIEATFRFALALLQKCEDDLLLLEFEDILAYLQGDLYEAYRQHTDDEDEWRANDFVRDAYSIRITPLMLDQYESEWNEKCREQDAHSRELDTLRNANRHLSQQVNSLEASLATMNNEHVELVRQLVMAKIAKEDMETELVKYKSMCAQLSQEGSAEAGSVGSTVDKE